MKGSANGLLGDLESIRALLEDDDLPIASVDADIDVDVESANDAAAPPLLSGHFHSDTAVVLQRARALIQQYAHQWSPQQTDDLSAALKVRIDDAVQRWINDSLVAHRHELEQHLQRAIHDELAKHLQLFEPKASSAADG